MHKGVRPGRAEAKRGVPTFNDDDLTVDDGNRERAVLHHGLLSAEVLQEMYKTRKRPLERENTLGEQNAIVQRGLWLIAKDEEQ